MNDPLSAVPSSPEYRQRADATDTASNAGSLQWSETVPGSRGNASSHDANPYLRLIQSITDYAIYTLDTRGHVINWNAGAQRAKGYVAEEIVGQHFSRFYTAEDRKKGLPQLGIETARRHGRYSSEGWRLRKDGSRFWAHVLIQPIYDDDHTLCGFAKITRDCTEQMRTARTLVDTTRNLDLALSNMLQGLSLFNKRGELVLSNRRFADLLRLPSDAFVPGMRVNQVLGLIEDHACAAPAASAAGDGPPGTGHTGRRVPALRPPSPAVTTARSNGRRLRQTIMLARSARPGTETFTLELNHLGRNILVVTRVLKSGGWVTTIEDVTDQRATERRIHHLAHFDALTELPNRISFQNQLKELLEGEHGGNGFALLYLDLDRFKAVNDTLGHHIGDLLLKAVSRRLSTVLRPGEQLARLGGDEFTITSMSCPNVEDAHALAETCLRELEYPFDIANNEVTIGVSIGVVVKAYSTALTAENALQQADLALYKAKREGRNCYCLYEPGMNDPLRMRSELEEDLRRALTNDDLDVHYQPIVNAQTGKTTAFEALLRWNHPRFGNIPPTEFIPLAEDRGLMQVLGAWVLRRACRDAHSWPRHVRLCVNVSPSQLLYHEFISMLRATLDSTDFPPSRLEIEITETALLENAATPREVLKTVCAMGIGVAMDDFGTGYSSLSLLQGFPFTRIKIDRSFIQGLGHNPKSMAIIQSVTGLCKSLGIATIAEGVETRAQVEALSLQECTELQGFLFSRPMPVDRIHDWFAEESIRATLGAPD